jgi:hypothetical protein
MRARARLTLRLAGILLLQAAAYAQTGKGAITGRILHADGRPAVNIPVVALELPDAKGLSSSDIVASSITDAQGRYHLADVATGHYGVFPNVLYAHEVPPRDLDAARRVIVRRGAPAVHDETLPHPVPGVSVSGRLLEGSTYRRPETVFLSTDDRTLRSTLASDRSFQFRNVPPGDYKIHAAVPQFVWTSREIRVENQDITGVDLRPEDSTPVTGRVITDDGSPVPAFGFYLEGAKGTARTNSIGVRDTVRSSGMVSVTGWADRPDDVIFDVSLPLGEYRIAVTGLPPGYQVKSLTYGVTNLFEKPLNIDGEIRQLSIALTPSRTAYGVKVRGRLIRDAALPPQLESNHVVLQSPLLLTPLEAAIGRDGSFEFSGVPPGVYAIAQPFPKLRLAVGSGGVRGLEFRTSEIRARHEEYVRLASTPSVRSSSAATTDSETPQEPPAPEGRLLAADGRLNSIKPVSVSGRVVGEENRSHAERIEVSLSGNSLLTTSVDSGGRFVFPEVPQGTYRIFTALAEGPNSKRIVVRDESIEDVEVPLSRAASGSRIVRGRIVVEGRYPLPLVALTVRPNIEAESTFEHPYTLRSGTQGGLAVDSEGRFLIELPEGHHRLRVDGPPESHQLKSFTFGSANLTNAPLVVAGGNLNEIVIVFTRAPKAVWTRVKGAIAGFANLPGPIRVVLLSNRTKLRLEALPQRDGSFEFDKVPPDTYSVTTAPRVAAMEMKSVVVAGREVSQVNLSLPARKTLTIQIRAGEGPTPPLPSSLILTLSRTEAYNILLSMPMVLRTASEWICVIDACSPSTEKMLGEPAIVSLSRANATVVLRVPEGEYRAELKGLPPGYELISLTNGAANLLEAPLRVGPATPENITVVLSRR